MELLQTKLSGARVGFLLMMVFVGYFYWPAMIVAMLVCAFINPASALMVGLMLDLIYGSPPENFLLLAYTPIPFTITAFFIMTLTYLCKKFLTAGEGRIKVGQ